MNDKISLNEFIDNLTQEIGENLDVSDLWKLGDVDVEISIDVQKDETGKMQFIVLNSESSGTANSNSLKFKLTPRSEPKSTHSLELEEDIKPTDESSDNDFQSFKKRFEASVIRHGGVPPNKKKNIFD